jgi:ATP-dependent helicase HrpB
MARLGVAPRLAHMIARAEDAGDKRLACALAAVLTERADGRDRTPDLRAQLARVGSDPAYARQREVARRLARQAGVAWGELPVHRAGAVLAPAFFDRIAQRRGQNGRYVLSGGPGAVLDQSEPLAAEEFLVVADLDGKLPDSRIYLVTPITREELELALPAEISTEDRVWFEANAGAVQARHQRRLGALILADAPLSTPGPDAVTNALLTWLARAGLSCLPWTPEAQALRARVEFLRRIDGPDSEWPDFSESGLTESLSQWLGPALAGRRKLDDLAALDLAALLRARLDWRRQQDLDARAPSHLTVPSGSRIPIDYGAGDTPVLAVRLQEMFGLGETPRVAGGKVTLQLHLLSPAHRPIQVTSDLRGFWEGSYRAVRADLRGRYPKHYWPENPLEAEPTARAKPRKG